MAKKTEEQSPSHERAKMLTMGQKPKAPEPVPVAENDDTPTPDPE
jgi:hypothetical protein